jgi:hypothetical protein
MWMSESYYENNYVFFFIYSVIFHGPEIIVFWQYNDKDAPEEIGEGSRKYQGKKARR